MNSHKMPDLTNNNEVLTNDYNSLTTRVKNSEKKEKKIIVNNKNYLYISQYFKGIKDKNENTNNLYVSQYFKGAKDKNENTSNKNNYVKQKNENVHSKNIYNAMLAEDCFRFKEMAQFLEDEFKQRNEDINSEERNSLIIAYRNLISGPRSSLKTIISFENREKKRNNSLVLSYILSYKNKVSDELLKDCQRVIKFVEEHLINKAKEDEAIVFYKQIIGDFNRYIAEFTEGDIKIQAINNATKIYDEAIEKAEKLTVLNQVKLGLYLNFAKFIYDFHNNRQKSIDISKKIILEVEKELKNIDKKADKNKDIISIYDVLKLNLENWLKEEKEK